MEYTCEEMNHEIDVLKRTFATVRLVNPSDCRVIELSEENDHLVCQTGGTCFKSWFYSYQCANCISARALLTGEAQSKYERREELLFHIISRPVFVAGQKLALEIVHPVDLTSEFYSDDTGTDSVGRRLLNSNASLLKDVDTPAYNRHYLNEHLPNIMIAAAQTGHTNAALVRIKNLDNILASSGSLAASGLMKGLHNILNKTFQTDTDTPLLVRYDRDSFFVYEKSMESAQFEKKLNELSQNARPERVLFQETRLPFSLATASARIGEECIVSGPALLTTLESRLNAICSAS
jgi:GGDEF domain-containing protein